MMLDKEDSLYFSSIIFNGYQDDFWNQVREESGEAGKFIIDLGKRINPNRFVTRHGEWSLPWKQELPPTFEMPEYDPLFAKSFSQVTDERALEIKKLINEHNQKFAVMYSGGIDSTIVLCALIKNLTSEELKNVVIATSSHAIVENPTFWQQFVYGKFKILDSASMKYDSLIEMGYRPITADEGDCIFGTALGLTLYTNYDAYLIGMDQESRSRLSAIKGKITSNEVHYSQYKDVIIKHFSQPHDPMFGENFYNKFVKNIETSSVPIHSLHDFFWWMIFNIKYLNCSIRGAIYFNDRIPVKEAIYDWIVNWFNGADYQRWSMVNNNNGEKIGYSQSTYKMAGRKYIYDLDKNSWYFHFKVKLESLGGSIVYAQNNDNLPTEIHPNARFGLDKDFNILYIDDLVVQNYIRENVTNYKKDW